jgi:nucleoside-diphosphate-sugar epimerase
VIHLIGASGRSGQALAHALRSRNTAFTPVIRNPARWPGPEAPVIADLSDPSFATCLSDALGTAETVVSCAHARHIPAILAAAPRATRFVFLGSTRKFTRWPDAHGNGVLAGEAAFQASGRPGVLLHPTMIYGAQGEDNVQRLAALLRRLPIVPLPGGGRALVRPIHQSDLTRCILAALDHTWTAPEALIVAGPTALPYADFVRAVAAAARLPPPRIVAVPPALLLLASPLTRLPGLPTIGAAEIRRLLEDKAFDITGMRSTLGVDPITLADGLTATFAGA